MAIQTVPLNLDNRQFLAKIFAQYPFSLQMKQSFFRLGRDLEMWKGPRLKNLWEKMLVSKDLSNRPNKQIAQLFYQTLLKEHGNLAEEMNQYSSQLQKQNIQKLQIKKRKSDRKIYGDCPVASAETVCCNLKVIDMVENCAFGCSYCTIQSFYGEKALFDENFSKKLNLLDLSPDRQYHIGTGQSSDSLQWGNRHNILQNLMNFAKKNSQVILELKTKSAKINYFLEHEIPANVFLSWSLNPQVIIANEEKGTASLNHRLAAARKVADKGIKVGFHFHPMIYYANWQKDYQKIIARIKSLFDTKEIAFTSVGTLTYIKPVISAIRKRGGESQILKMPMKASAKGKMSYPMEIKVKLFSTFFQEWGEWEKKVFTYLCMEPHNVWQKVRGWYYPYNKIFEKEMLKALNQKLNLKDWIVEDQL